MGSESRPACRLADRWDDGAFDPSFDADDRRAVRAPWHKQWARHHHNRCVACRSRLAAWERVLHTIRTLDRPLAPAHLHAAVMGRIANEPQSDVGVTARLPRQVPVESELSAVLTWAAWAAMVCWAAIVSWFAGDFLRAAAGAAGATLTWGWSRLSEVLAAVQTGGGAVRTALTDVIAWLSLWMGPNITAAIWACIGLLVTALLVRTPFKLRT